MSFKGLTLGQPLRIAIAATLLCSAAAAQTRPPTAAGPAPAYAPPAYAPAAAPPAAAPPTEECIPACRPGFLCAHGQCVSPCNPPCGANEVCSAAGQCVATGPAPYGAPATAAPPGAVGAQGATAAPGTMSLATPPPAEPPAPEAKIKVFSFVPRIGMQLGGSGSLSMNCDGNACATASGESGDFGTGSTDYDHKTGFVIGADFMFKVHDLIRIGPGILHTFASDISPSGGGASEEFGSLTELNFVGEVIPKVSPTVWLVPRLQVGMMMFNASGPMKDSLTSLKNDCSTMAASAAGSGVTVNGCDSFDNPHIGYDVGAGFGVMFAVGPTIRLRVDALYEHFSVSGGEMDISDTAGDSLKQTYSASGNRYFLMGGLEI